jgi:hypothetical protein
MADFFILVYPIVSAFICGYVLFTIIICVYRCASVANLSLFQHGANHNSQYEGKTPRAMALEKKQASMIQILRSHGGKQ